MKTPFKNTNIYKFKQEKNKNPINKEKILNGKESAISNNSWFCYYY